MICDTLKNRNLYAALSPRIKVGLDYLAKTDFSVIDTGRYELEGSNLFVLVQKYDSIPKEQGKWECHQKYIDIQYIAEGSELIGFRNIDKMKITTEYNPEKDVAFLDEEGDYATFDKGFYGIFFPQESINQKLLRIMNPGM